MGRDHSVACDLCGASYGGFDGPDKCPCRVDVKFTPEQMDSFSSCETCGKTYEDYAHAHDCTNPEALLREKDWRGIESDRARLQAEVERLRGLLAESIRIAEHRCRRGAECSYDERERLPYERALESFASIKKDAGL
jgi:hypothetical protein